MCRYAKSLLLFLLLENVQSRDDDDDNSCFVKLRRGEASLCGGAERYVQRHQSLPRGKYAGSAVCFPLFTSVGNVLESILFMLEMVYFLDAAMIIDTSTYPDFGSFIVEGAAPWHASRSEYQMRPLVVSALTRPCQSLWCASLICPNTLSLEKHLHTYSFRDGGWLQLTDHAHKRLQSLLQLGPYQIDAVLNSTVTHTRQAPEYLRQAAMRKTPSIGRNPFFNPGIAPCLFNSMFRRSSLLIELMNRAVQGLERQRQRLQYEGLMAPDSQQASLSTMLSSYFAMHIRTAHNEDSRWIDPSSPHFSPRLSMASPELLCKVYVSAAKQALRANQRRATMAVRGSSADGSVTGASSTLIMVASNDPSVKRECFNEGAAAIDLYMNVDETHTSKGGLEASGAAFTDFFAMLDADGIVKSVSSLSSMVVRLNGLACAAAPGASSKTPEGQVIYACLAKAQSPKSCRLSTSNR